MASTQAPCALPSQPPGAVQAEAAPMVVLEEGAYAVARVGTLHIAVANSVVSQAVACPEQLVKLPRRAGALEGLLFVQGQWVPVLQLGAWVDIGTAPQAGGKASHLLVLRQAGQVIGLRVDRVLGLRQVKRGEVVRVHHDERPEELFQSVIAAQGELPALSVLEPGRLMDLAAAWCEAAEVEPAASAAIDAPGTSGATRAHAQSFATFRIGDLWLGIPAADVGELIPAPPMQAVMPPGSAARGICNWRGLLVPVVDLTELLAAGAGDHAPSSVCIVRSGGLAIGVLVHEVGALTAVEAGSVERLNGSSPERALLRGTTLTSAGLMLHLLDAARLMARFPETELSAPRTALSSAAGTGRERSADTFIVFNAGSLRATPAAQVQEVVQLPADLLVRLDAGQPATLAWRGFAVAVVDLRLHLEDARDMQPSHLVIVAEGERRTAVTIAGVTELIPAHSATRTRVTAGARLQFDMVTLDGPGRKLSYTVLDLAGFIPAAVLAPAALV